MKLTIWVAAASLIVLAGCATSAPSERSGAVTSTDTPAMRTSAPGTRASAATNEGTVVGVFMRVGGPLGVGGTQPRPVPLMGTVLFSAGHRRTVEVRVGKTGGFSVSLLAGTYVVVGRSPSMGWVSASGALVVPPCSPPTRVIVTAGRTVRVSVTCPVP